MRRKDFITGLLIAAILPIIFYFFFDFLDRMIVQNDILNKLTGSSSMLWGGFKESTVILFAICMNLIPTFFANRKRKEERIRGLMIPTVIYSFIWFFYFKSSLF